MSTHDTRRTTTWKPLTADDVRRHAFQRAILGRRGYRPEDVDAYLDRLATEIERWTAAHDAAAAEVERLRNYFRHHGVDSASEREGPSAAHASAVVTLAQDRASQLVGEGEGRASQLTGEARATAEAMLSKARVHAEAIVAHARREAEGVAQSCRNVESAERQRVAAVGESVLVTLRTLAAQLNGAGGDIRAAVDTLATELSMVASSERPCDRYVGRVVLARPHADRP